MFLTDLFCTQSTNTKNETKCVFNGAENSTEFNYHAEFESLFTTALGHISGEQVDLFTENLMPVYSTF
jgi:hypothetical protein